MALDVMVDFLHDEAEYWHNVVSDKCLWDQKHKSTATTSRRYTKKRVRVAQYFPDSSSSTDSLSDDEVERDTQDNRASSNTRNISLLPFPQEQITIGHVKHICSNYTTSKIINKDCTLKVCKRCCVVSTGKCKLTTHKCGKTTTSRPYLETLAISEHTNHTKDVLICAIEEKHSVYISYMKRIHSEGPRKVDLKIIKTGNLGQLVAAYYHTTNNL
jgi:hypothetical protein